jgi:hypothetical protein
MCRKTLLKAAPRPDKKRHKKMLTISQIIIPWMVLAKAGVHPRNGQECFIHLCEAMYEQGRFAPENYGIDSLQGALEVAKYLRAKGIVILCQKLIASLATKDLNNTDMQEN